MRRAGSVTGPPNPPLGYGVSSRGIGSMEGGGSLMDPEGGFSAPAPAKKSRYSPAHPKLPIKTAPGLAVTVAATLLLMLLVPSGAKPVVLVTGCCCAGILVTSWLADSVLSKDDGTPAMRAVSDPIKEGAEGFLKVQYTAIAKIAVFLLAFIVTSYVLRPTGSAELQNTGVRQLGNTTLGLISGMCFFVGALCSAAAGYISMWVSAHANIRVASAARRSYGEALVICFGGGAFSAVLDITLCVAGVTLLYVTLYTCSQHRGSQHHRARDENIITGMAVGMKSTAIPCITVSVAVIAVYHLGRTPGVGDGHSAGIFGTAVATMGMLSSAVYVLSMNSFGPIADNAGGIAEMSQQPEFVRETTDRLDPAGNVTKAITKVSQPVTRSDGAQFVAEVRAAGIPGRIRCRVLDEIKGKPSKGGAAAAGRR